MLSEAVRRLGLGTSCPCSCIGRPCVRRLHCNSTSRASAGNSSGHHKAQNTSKQPSTPKQPATDAVNNDVVQGRPSLSKVQLRDGIGNIQEAGRWRLYDVPVLLKDDPGKDDTGVHPTLRFAVRSRLRLKANQQLPDDSIMLVRKAFDARQPMRFVYTVDVASAALHALHWKPTTGPSLSRMERIAVEPSTSAAPQQTAVGTASAILVGHVGDSATPPPRLPPRADPVIVIGSGPAGLFAALEMAEAGLPVVLLERGKPVEERGRDIGALFVRRRLDPDSNLCYGEGGAGTWSDGKLVTRIGHNSDPVRRVLQALVNFGAPPGILVAGKPHLGTDRLVLILKAFRQHLVALGVTVRFSTKVEDLVVERDGRVTGVTLAGGQQLRGSAVVLAVGHSARPMYRQLVGHGVAVAAKPFAMGFRIEHPQAMIDEVKYGRELAAGVMRGKGKLPVADYTLATQILDTLSPNSSSGSSSSSSAPATSLSRTSGVDAQGQYAGGLAATASTSGRQADTRRAGAASGSKQSRNDRHGGRSGGSVGAKPGSVANAASSSSSRLGASEKRQRDNRDDDPRGGVSEDGGEAGGSGQSSDAAERHVYSFCMCPGGQIVPTSTNPDQLCINGMSFSRRNSLWANAALVVAVQPSDWAHLTPQHGVMAGVALQEHIESVAAVMGGGNFVAPVQRVTDFLAASVSPHASLPTSSYRLGVHSAALHDLYSPALTQAIGSALHRFDRRLPGFISDQGLLHGVETRTSSPVQITRDADCQSVSTPGLYPCGEGAGYAGGIVSAAVDGLRVGKAVVGALLHR